MLLQLQAQSKDTALWCHWIQSLIFVLLFLVKISSVSIKHSLIYCCCTFSELLIYGLDDWDKVYNYGSFIVEITSEDVWMNDIWHSLGGNHTISRHLAKDVESFKYCLGFIKLDHKVSALFCFFVHFWNIRVSFGSPFNWFISHRLHTGACMKLMLLSYLLIVL